MTETNKATNSNYFNEPSFFNGRGQDFHFYSSELFQRFLISKSTPANNTERSEIEKISKNLSLLLWIGKAQFLSTDEEEKIINQIKELTDNFKQESLYEQTNNIIQKIKNISTKASIIEHFTDIEYQACVCNNDNESCINSEILHEEFKRIISVMDGVTDKFLLIKLERELVDIKNIFFGDSSQTSLLLQNLESITRQ